MRCSLRLWLGTLAACVALWASQASHAQGRSAFPGYLNIQIGMSESSLQQAITLRPDIRYAETGGYWRQGVAPVEIAGAPFVLQVLVVEGLVRRISLLDLVSIEPPACAGEFDKARRYAESLYGEADTNIKGASEVLKEFYRATFAFADGVTVNVESFLVNRGKACGTSIVVFAPHDAPDMDSVPGDV